MQHSSSAPAAGEIVTKARLPWLQPRSKLASYYAEGRWRESPMQIKTQNCRYSFAVKVCLTKVQTLLKEALKPNSDIANDEGRG